MLLDKIKNVVYGLIIRKDIIVIKFYATQEKIVTVSEEDCDLSNMKWQYYRDGYAKRKFAVDGKRVNKAMHRLIAERMLGRELADGEVVDHINHNRLDNRRENLRVCSVTENNINRRLPAGKSGYRGVVEIRGYFVAKITVNGKTITIGKFESAEIAFEAYTEKAIELFGDFVYWG